MRVDTTAALVQLETITDERGSLTVTERGLGLPFAVERIFLLHDLAADALRGEHANRRTHELILCTAGAITVTAEDATGAVEHRLERPDLALHVPPLVWVRLHDPTPDAVVVVAASTGYDPDDAIRDRDELRRLRDEA